MKRNRIRTTEERNKFFEIHVLDYFEQNEQQLFEQVAYMMNSSTGINYRRTYEVAQDLATGGCFLVSWYEVDELRKEQPGCIDGRLTMENAWIEYVRECTNAVCRIVRRFNITPENVHEIAIKSMYEKFVDHHESDLYIKKTPVSRFIIDSMNNTSLLSTFIDSTDDSVWYELPFCYNPNL